MANPSSNIQRRSLLLVDDDPEILTLLLNPQELILRINNVLKRVYKEDGGPESFTRGDLTVDFLKHEVTVKGQLAQLTLTEFKLLSSLIESVGQVKTREFLLERIWEHSEGVYSRTIDTHIQRLRTKLKSAGRYIETASSKIPGSSSIFLL